MARPVALQARCRPVAAGNYLRTTTVLGRSTATAAWGKGKG